MDPVSIVNAIPQVWAAAILRALDTLLVYGAPDVINRDYEGEIADAGDTVNIVTVGDVTISNYVKDTDMAGPEALVDAALKLVIDQQKSFNFAVDNIDAAQMKPKLMDEAARRAGYSMRKVQDSFIGALYTDISATNQIGSDASPITGTWLTAGTLAYDRLVDLSVMLDTTDTPEEDRFVVVPPWFEGYLLKDSRFVGFGTVAQDQRLTNGRIGKAAGFTVYKSNQVPNTTATKYKVIAGHKSAWSFATQLTQVKAYEPEKRFAEALKGLAVYGAKVVRPANLAVLTGNST